jgi:GNAT superfamily N-acetyltransferase
VGEVSANSPPSAPEPLSANHNLEGFDSGIPPLDVWLKNRAIQNESTGASRTFVVSAGSRVVGYYSLAAASVIHQIATAKVRRNMPDPVPAAVIGRLAVDKAWQGRKLGVSLLQDAMLRVVGAADMIGIRVVLVHAISDRAKSFYEGLGFRASPVEPMTLMMTVDDVRGLLNRSA